ncbi:CHAT domain-containing protein [Actinoplanes sp. NPDC051411]|uniref:CHAT domain-containing protein n=1 Tax=Actinoplanes sp. NPDC051411 TaxID=3155522 RepID=UPI00341F7C07
MSVEVEYEVVIGAERIHATLRGGGEEAEFDATVSDDEQRKLQRDTIEVLRSWLARWTAFARQTDYADLAVRDTATVLGRHLYALVFVGELRTGLTKARDAARRTRTSLRLQLNFQESDELAQLPWEMLNVDGDFLASEHHLVLSRRLPAGRRRLEPLEPPLTVHFLVTLPKTPAYQSQRDELIAALDNPMEYTSSISHQVLAEWSEDAAVKLLSTRPYPQIVHIVGVCRPNSRDPRSMETFLDDGDGEGPKWRSAQTLLNIFRENEVLPEEDQVRLVVLHLCEPSPLEFEVTFARLAPALIRRGIPAVLAMQYPLSGKAGARFVKRLYGSLTEESDRDEVRTIEEAVQRARSDLFTTYDQDRVFGSPVLYMQTMDSQLLRLRTGSPAGADAGPGTASAAPLPPRSVPDWLRQRLHLLNKPADLTGEAERVIGAADWPPRVADAGRPLADLVRKNAYQPELAEVFRLLAEAVKAERGESDD